MSDSIKTRKRRKTAEKFPLFQHQSGRWCKKVKGKFLYFGKITDDPTGELALNRWLDEKEDRLAGRTPRPKTDGLTVASLCNLYLTSKRHRVDSGEITERTFRDYFQACERVVKFFGGSRAVADLMPDDFRALRAHYAKVRGPVGLANEITRCKMIFGWGFESQHLTVPVRFGPDFRKPDRKTIRKHRAEKQQQYGKRMFEADELRTILDAASQPLKAMILLAVNCGYGQSDLASLPIAVVDLDAGWIDFPRPKTGVHRRCPLWPETIETVKEWMKRRPEPRDTADRRAMFITKYGARFSNVGSNDDPIGKEFSKLLKRLSLKRFGVNFYALRHGFETIAGESRDQVAVDYVMGHARDDMASLYREAISDDRLRAVVSVVHQWLFATEGGAE